ncbi:MAG TPA: heme-copper oxidase subunit III [Vicinamibacteria bacterium]|nr:heme-copper oxidase subunit III [Vicinamibacteria bacterium]
MLPSGLLEDAPPLSDTGSGSPPPERAAPEEDDRGRGPTSFDPARFGLLAFLGSVSMLFVGFTSSLMLRRLSADWQPLTAPGLLYFNTLALAASSACLEAARRRVRSSEMTGTRGLVYVTFALGLVFVGGQFLAWRSLAAQGIYLSTNPSSSFFYMLTGIHLLHLAGGLVWLAVLATRVRRMAIVPGTDALGLFALYWHFLGLLWLYLLVVLFVI